MFWALTILIHHPLLYAKLSFINITSFWYTFEFRRLFSHCIILECSFGRKGLWMGFPELYILDFRSCLLSVLILIMFLVFLASTLVARFLLLVIDVLFLRVRLLLLEKFLYYVFMVNSSKNQFYILFVVFSFALSLLLKQWRQVGERSENNICKK